MPETNTPLDTSTPRRDGADVVAFTAINPLGVQNWYFEAISLRPIHSRAYASAPALPLTPQDSLPTRWLDSGRTGLSPAGRLFRISWLSHFAFPFGPAFPGRTDGHPLPRVTTQPSASRFNWRRNAPPRRTKSRPEKGAFYTGTTRLSLATNRLGSLAPCEPLSPRRRRRRF